MDGRLDLLLLGSCAVLLVAVFAVRIAARTGLPVLLLYLGLGLALGESGLGIKFEDYRLTSDLGLIALALILAEGGLTTRWAVVKPVLPFALLLSTLGVAVSVAVITVASVLLLGVDVRTGILLAAVVSSTDAAAVFSVLRRVPLRGRVKAVLEAESGINDAPVVVLVVLASSDSWGRASIWHSAALVAYELLAGAVLGLAIGVVGRWFLARAALPSVGLYPIATLAITLVAFTGTSVLHASGFLAVYICGVVLGNARLPHRRAVLGFASSTALLAEVGLFVLLGLLASPGRLGGSLVDALVVGAAATLIARPLAVFASALPWKVPVREQLFLSWAGLRGAVPVVLATIPVVANLAGATKVVDVVFVLVVVYTLVQAPTLPLLARALRLVESAAPRELEVEAAPLDDMRADLLQLVVHPGSRLHGTYSDELRLPVGARLALVVRDGQTVAIDSNTQLRNGDQVLIVAGSGVREATELRLRAIARGGSLARWNSEPEPSSALQLRFRRPVGVRRRPGSRG